MKQSLALIRCALVQISNYRRRLHVLANHCLHVRPIWQVTKAESWPRATVKGRCARSCRQHGGIGVEIHHSSALGTRHGPIRSVAWLMRPRQGRIIPGKLWRQKTGRTSPRASDFRRSYHERRYCPLGFERDCAGTDRTGSLHKWLVGSHPQRW